MMEKRKIPIDEKIKNIGLGYWVCPFCGYEVITLSDRLVEMGKTRHLTLCKKKPLP